MVSALVPRSDGWGIEYIRRCPSHLVVEIVSGFTWSWGRENLSSVMLTKSPCGMPAAQGKLAQALYPLYGMIWLPLPSFFIQRYVIL